MSLRFPSGLALGSTVKLAIPCRGPNNSTFFEDVSPYHRTVTVAGNAKNSNGQTYFGQNMAYFDGSGDYLQIASGADFNFGANPFLIEAKVFPTATGGYDVIGEYNSQTGIGRYSLHIDGSGHAKFICYDSGGSAIVTLTGTTNLVNGRHHVGVSRSAANRFDLWVDGTSEANATSATAIRAYDANTPILIGAEHGSSNYYYYTGYIADAVIRIGTSGDGKFAPRRIV